MPATTRTLLPALLILATVVPAWSEEQAELENLRHRLEKLEARENGAEEFALLVGEKKLRLWGALEIEAAYRDQREQPAESEITVATALLGLDVTHSDRLSGHLALLHEEGEEPEVALDEAHLTVSLPTFKDGEMKVTAGLNHLPFGAFTSIMVSDPLTLELGETNRTALLASWANAKVTAQAGIFNGKRETTGQNRIDNGIAALTFAPGEQFSLGVSYLSDLAESAADLLGEGSTSPGEKITAASAYLTLKLSPVTVNLEYLGALKAFSGASLADPGKSPDLTGSKPRTWFAELSFAPADNWAVSCRYEQAQDYQDDVSRYGATFSYGLEASATMSLEYLYSDFARAAADTASQVTVQLAMEF